jgi:hypothetical protein
MGDRFVLSSECEKLSPELISKYSHCLKIPLQENIMRRIHIDKSGSLYVMTYFPDHLEEYDRGATPFPLPIPQPCFFVNWRDEKFMSRLRRLLSPVASITTPLLPSDRICVALHVRRGGGFDAPCVEGTAYFYQNGSDRRFPYKFPPLSFFTEHLIALHDELGMRPLYVYVFTDEPNPEELINRMSRYMVDRDIVFDCRHVGNAHNKNVIEDFIFMQKFTYLIRSQSNFSYMASRLSTSISINIEPCGYTWEGQWLSIIKSRITYADGHQVIRNCFPQRYR